MLDYASYRATSYFRALDGLRAVSILLVLAFHANMSRWTSLHGWLGVQVFFVISGYLITTLLLREASKRGCVSLRSFYVRRTFRIFPLYYATLLVYVLVYFVIHFRPSGRLQDVFPYYLTYMNDFAPFRHGGTPFEQSWSLGVEEKFYVLWPLLAFVILRFHDRLRVVAALVLAGLPTALWVVGQPVGKANPYGAILVGCVLALALHDERLFQLVRVLGRPVWAYTSLAVAVLLLIAAGSHAEAGNLLFPWAVAGAMVSWLLTDQPIARFLKRPTMVYIGTRAYGIYLVHLLVLLFLSAAVRDALPSLQFDMAGEVVASASYPATLLFFVVMTVISLGIAAALNRTIEAPCIEIGRRITRRISGSDPIAPDRMGHETTDGEAVPRLQPVS